MNSSDTFLVEANTILFINDVLIAQIGQFERSRSSHRVQRSLVKRAAIIGVSTLHMSDKRLRLCRATEHYG
jgi:hypothetical protein